MKAEVWTPFDLAEPRSPFLLLVEFLLACYLVAAFYASQLKNTEGGEAGLKKAFLVLLIQTVLSIPIAIAVAFVRQ
jgi:hypothetical protein